MDIRQYLPTSSVKSWQVLLVLMAVLILGIGAVGYQRVSRPPGLPPGQAPPEATPTKPETALWAPSLSTASLIYGTWESGSTIKAINVDGSNHVTIAQLPSNIKDVNVVSDHELLYIAETDDKDHGQKVNLYDLQTGQFRTLFAATPGFGIDDLVISPDKQWVATWEVKFAPGSKILSGGDSRVYITDLTNPQNKILIVDERNVSDTNFLRYPLFFDSQNRLFLDTFGPNGGGWNRGLWVVNADGSGLSPVPGMNDGEYSIDPVPSPDGRKVVFAGYDPTAFPQLKENPASGILRPAIANPNLLQIMDLTNFQKTTLLGSANGSQYANPVWSKNQEKIAFQKFTVSGPESSKFEGVFIYDVASGRVTQILSAEDYPSLEILSFDQEFIFWGRPTENTGNLGSNYQAIFDGFFVTNLADLTTSSITAGPALQFIDYLTKAPGTVSALSVTTQATGEPSPLSLKLKSFEIKPIAQVRNPQQNNPQNPNLPTCQDLLGGVGGVGAGATLETWAAAMKAGKCTDSPLYLYPEKETLVTIKVNPPAELIYSEPVYKNGWQVLAYPDGNLTTPEGKTLFKISYTYLTPISPISPNSGLVVKTADLEQTLQAYAQNIGLQGQEASDFVSFWWETLSHYPDYPDSPYIFISHFTKDQSQKMLPLEISPKPDTLIQIVMYFKLLEKPIEVLPPVFEKIPQRKGFTAVDWSGMIDGS